eukprot:4580185-Prymnesium_polylepis.1
MTAKPPAPELSQVELDLLEPLALEWGDSSSVLSLGFSCFVCTLMWICQLLAITGMFWNMEERVRESYVRPLTGLGLRGPVEYLPGYNNGQMTPTGDWGFIVPNGAWRAGLIFWCIGMAANLGSSAAAFGSA